MATRYAHRGVHRTPRTENRLEGFRAARRRGYGIELDARLAADGVAVVVHDATLRRTHGVARRVASTPAAALDVPTLAEVLRDPALAGAPVVVDVKDRRLLADGARALPRECFDADRVCLLLWGDDWPVPSGARALRARHYRFAPPPASSPLWGVACKFDGSPANLAAIDRALASGAHVNLFPPRRADRAALERRYGDHPQCSLTLDVG